MTRSSLPSMPQIASIELELRRRSESGPPSRTVSNGTSVTSMATEITFD